MIATSLWGWFTLPETVPVHWNAQGEIDRYGSKLEGVGIMPVVAVGMYLLFLALPRIDPWRDNYQRFAGAYSVLRVGLLAFFAFLDVLIVGSTAGLAIDVPMAIGVAMALVFILLGSVLSRVKPNFFVGIRTPWTLASPRSWALAHQWGGWIFIVGGVVVGAAIITRSAIAIVGAIVLLMTALIILVVFSYLWWRDDPDRIAAPLPR